MTSLKQTRVWTAAAGRTDALTAAWKKAFDNRIRAAALTRTLPLGREAKARAPVPGGDLTDSTPRR